MRILHTSDWHVGRRIRGRDRIDEHQAVLSEIVGVASDNEVDLTIVAGDTFDTASPSPAAEAVVWRTLLDLSEVSPVVVVSGNHDNPARLDAVAPLLLGRGVTVVGAPRSPEDGGLLHLEDTGVKVALLPFVSQRSIVKASHIMSADPDQHAGKYQERLAAIIEKLTGDMNGDTVNVLVSHLTVYGALAGGGERQAHIFGYAIPSSLFPGHLSYVALGHLHRQQPMPHPSQVWYSGSPLQLDFGEVADQKGVLLVDAKPGLPAEVKSVPLSGGRNLVTIAGSLDEVLGRTDDLGDTWVKVVLDEKARVGLADAVRDAIPNVVDVILESPESEMRTITKRQGLDPHEAFSEYLSDKDTSDEKVEQLFAELLDEVLAR